MGKSLEPWRGMLKLAVLSPESGHDWNIGVAFLETSWPDFDSVHKNRRPWISLLWIRTVVAMWKMTEMMWYGLNTNTDAVLWTLTYVCILTIFYQVSIWIFDSYIRNILFIIRYFSWFYSCSVSGILVLFFKLCPADYWEIIFINIF